MNIFHVMEFQEILHWCALEKGNVSHQMFVFVILDTNQIQLVLAILGDVENT